MGCWTLEAGYCRVRIEAERGAMMHAAKNKSGTRLSADMYLTFSAVANGDRPKLQSLANGRIFQERRILSID